MYADQQAKMVSGTAFGMASGSVIGAIQPPREHSEVERELSVLRDRINNLGRCAEELVSRLSAVTIPYPSNVESTKPAPACGSSLGNALNDLSSAVSMIERQLASTLKALAL